MMFEFDEDDATRMTGEIDEASFGSGEGLTRVETQVVNLDLVNREELWLIAGGWRIHLDVVNPPDRGSVRDAAAYWLTIKLSLDQEQRRRFSGQEARDLLDAFDHFASLVRGAWVGHVNLVGRNRAGRALWEHWVATRADHSEMGSGWATELDAYSRDSERSDRDDPLWLPSLWAGFLSMWQDADLRKTMKALIAMFIEAEAHTQSEAGLVIGQVVLELMSWTLVVNDLEMLSAEGYEKVTAADRIRLLLSVVGHDKEILAAATELRAAARGLNWSDGPQAITEIRNMLVHPTRRHRLATLDPRVIGQALGLTLAYAERTIAWWLAPNWRPNH